MSAALLASDLADEAHERLVYAGRRPLAYNSILMGKSRHYQPRKASVTSMNKTISDGSNGSKMFNDSTNDQLSDDSNLENELIMVDVSGNFYSCKAVAIGRMRIPLNNWLETKGVELARKFQFQGKDSQNVTKYPEDYTKKYQTTILSKTCYIISNFNTNASVDSNTTSNIDANEGLQCFENVPNSIISFPIDAYNPTNTITIYNTQEVNDKLSEDLEICFQIAEHALEDVFGFDVLTLDDGAVLEVSAAVGGRLIGYVMLCF